jgi:probable F420-dependent oxidoreductase
VPSQFAQTSARAREQIGRIGVWSGALNLLPATLARDAVAEFEELGYGAIWFPEPVGGKEALAHAALLLSWSERITVAAAIANIWARDAIAMANGARALSDAYPDRFLLGLGTSNEVSVPARGHEFARPLSRMRSYLDAMDEAPSLAPEPAAPVRRFLAALGPRMLELAAERSIGAHPYFVPVEHTAFAREQLGPEPLLAVAQPFVVMDDVAGKAVRRHTTAHMSFYLARNPYRQNLKRFGWTDADFEDGGSDALLEAIVAWGDVDAIAARVQAHFDAGADHVCLQPLDADPSDPKLTQLRRLAAALIDTTPGSWRYSQ